MEKGLIVEQGAADQVLNHPAHPYTKRLIAAVPRRRAAEHQDRTQAPALEVRTLRKTYHLGKAHWFAAKRDVNARNDVSFTVHAGSADKRRVGKTCVCKGRSWWSAYQYKKKKIR